MTWYPYTTVCLTCCGRERLSGLVLRLGEQGPINGNNKILVYHLLHYFTGYTSQHVHNNFTKRSTK